MGFYPKFKELTIHTSLHQSSGVVEYFGSVRVPATSESSHYGVTDLLTTPLHAKATRLYLPKAYTVCSIYLTSNLTNLFKQLLAPVVMLENSIVKTRFGVIQLPTLSPPFYTGIPTYKRMDTNTSFCFDISLCFISVLDCFRWFHFGNLW